MGKGKTDVMMDNLIWEDLKVMLTPRTYKVLYGRFKEGKTFKEVGQELKVTGERIRQLQARALKKIRRFVMRGKF